MILRTIPEIMDLKGRNAVKSLSLGIFLFFEEIVISFRKKCRKRSAGKEGVGELRVFLMIKKPKNSCCELNLLFEFTLGGTWEWRKRFLI